MFLKFNVEQCAKLLVTTKSVIAYDFLQKLQSKLIEEGPFT